MTHQIYTFQLGLYQSTQHQFSADGKRALVYVLAIEGYAVALSDLHRDENKIGIDALKG